MGGQPQEPQQPKTGAQQQPVERLRARRGHDAPVPLRVCLEAERVRERVREREADAAVGGGVSVED